VKNFEAAYAQVTGAKYCLALSSGTGALATSMAVAGVGPGDEVILPPYTFVATLNVILTRFALPVFVDSDADTFQIDARKIEAAITPQTKVIMPVHIGGAPADLDTILAVAQKHGKTVVEDACQAHLAEWRGRKVGNYGMTGSFSFQATKNLTCGEGGALITNDDAVYDRCFSFHWNGTTSPRRKAATDNVSGSRFVDDIAGTKYTMTEFQAAVLTAQLARLAPQAKKRDQNAAVLDRLFRDLPGIKPQKMYEGCTRGSWLGYLFRYQKEHFAGMPRAKFLKALAAEGIPASAGYDALNRQDFLKRVLQSRSYRRIYSPAQLKRLEERNHCPENDKLCEEAVWLTRQHLLAGPSDMEQIAEAIRKVQMHAGELAKM
jgi:perosamine synthetase